MMHIFCLHSNICVITSLSLIEQLLIKNEKIIILSTRGCSFDYFTDKVVVFDLQKDFAGMQTILGSLLSMKTYSTIPRYKLYLIRLKNYLNKIINNEEYFFYTPNFGTSVAPILENNRLCKGYYFLEEGTLSYLDYIWLKEKWFSRKTRFANVIRRLFGLNSFFQLTTTEKFKGTISLSPFCFPWNKNEKIVVSPNTYIEQTRPPFEHYKGIILIGYYVYDLKFVETALKKAVSALNKSIESVCDMAVKLHPHTYSYTPNYAYSLERLIKTSFPEMKILPIAYSVELSIIKYDTQIVSIFGLSSLSLYSIMLKSIPTYNIRYEKGDVETEKIDSLEEYLKTIYN